MKKTKFLVLIFLSLLILTGCVNNSSVEEKKYSITFEENGGAEVNDITGIEKGNTVTLPTAMREGYVFKGWYTSKNFISGTMVTNETAIGKDIKLYAKWVALSFNINIDLDGGTMDSRYLEGDNTLSYGVEISLPMPKKEGYLFQGWFLNNEPFDGNFTVTKDANITTKWVDKATVKDKYNVSLNLDGGKLYKYNIKEDLVEDFFNDFSAFAKQAVNSENFSDVANRNLIGEGSFFANSKYHDKWIFLIEYLATTARDEYKDYFVKLLNNEEYEEDQRYLSRRVIKNEILAFLVNAERNDVDRWGPSIMSGNYTEEALQKGYLAYCQIEAPTEYVVGEGLELKEPIKEGYYFLGWYDNAEFVGKTYTKIDVNEFGDRTFYALWQKVE